MSCNQHEILPTNYRFRTVNYELAMQPLYEKMDSIERFIERIESLMADAEDICPHHLDRFNFILADLKSEHAAINDKINNI